MSKNLSEEEMRADLERIQLQMNATTDEVRQSSNPSMFIVI